MNGAGVARGVGLAAFSEGTPSGDVCNRGVNGAYCVLCYGFDVGFGFYRRCGLLGAGDTDAGAPYCYAGYWGYG